MIAPCTKYDDSGLNVSTYTCSSGAGIVLLEGGAISLDGGGAVGGVGGSFLNLPPGHLWCLAGAICSAIHVVRTPKWCHPTRSFLGKFQGLDLEKPKTMNVEEMGNLYKKWKEICLGVSG